MNNLKGQEYIYFLPYLQHLWYVYILEASELLCIMDIFRLLRDSDSACLPYSS